MFEVTTGTMWPSKRSDPTQSTPGWDLWARGTGAPAAERSFTRHASHARPMRAVPEVFMGLNAVDLLVGGPLCVGVAPAAVTAAGLDVRFTTLSGARVWSAGAAWVAFVPAAGAAHPAAQTGRVHCDARTPGYRLHERAPAAAGGPREHACAVAFPRPFDARLGPPAVVAVVAGLRAPAATWLRLRVAATDVRPDGFTLRVTTWGDSTLDEVTVAWLACAPDLVFGPNGNGVIMNNGVMNNNGSSSTCGSGGARVACGTVACMNTSPAFCVAAGRGPRDFVQRAVFGPAPFADDPEVVTFLSGMEVCTRTDVRLKAVERARTRAGCDLVFGTWADTSVRGGDITWLAVLDGVSAAAAAAVAACSAPAGVRDASGRRANFVPCGGAGPRADAGRPEPGMECVVCFERAKDTLLQPCNHICVCSECARRLNPPICPVCRTGISGMAKVFFA